MECRPLRVFRAGRLLQPGRMRDQARYWLWAQGSYWDTMHIRQPAEQGRQSQAGSVRGSAIRYLLPKLRARAPLSWLLLLCRAARRLLELAVPDAGPGVDL